MSRWHSMGSRKGKRVTKKMIAQAWRNHYKTETNASYRKAIHLEARYDDQN